MNALSDALRPDLVPDRPLNLTMESAHLEIAVFAMEVARGVAQRAFLARGPLAAGNQACRSIGLLHQAEARFRALNTPEAIIALNAILRAQYEAGNAAIAENLG